MNRWYVVYTQPRSEDRAFSHLRMQGFKCFLPKMSRLTSHARRRTRIFEPLFPRYLFTYFDPALTRWRCINGSRGVVQLLTQGADPLAVPNGIVERLTSVCDEEGTTSLVDLGLLKKGSKVRIREGAFTGQIGEIEQLPVSASARVKILLNLLGRTSSAELPVHAFEAA